MGMRLIILLALLVGVLYSLHLLVKDYQALSAPRLLRLLFKRDINAANYSKPYVRWKKILLYDPIQCARYLYCDLGSQPPDSELRRGFTFMLTVDAREEDKYALDVFKQAYQHGRLSQGDKSRCRREYPMCPFQSTLLIKLIEYLLHSNSSSYLPEKN